MPACRRASEANPALPESLRTEASHRPEVEDRAVFDIVAHGQRE